MVTVIINAVTVLKIDIKVLKVFMKVVKEVIEVEMNLNRPSYNHHKIFSNPDLQVRLLYF